VLIAAGMTKLNERSSRSHSIFTLSLLQKKSIATPDQGSARHVSAPMHD
jgi:hypothetical protein